MLEVGIPPFGFTQLSQSPYLQEDWDEIDRLLEGFLDRHPDFKFVIRAAMLFGRGKFQARVQEIFPFMAMRNRIQFETSPDVDEC